MSALVISETVTKILKNFAGISNSLLVQEGQTQKTMAASKSVLAQAQFPEAWPQQTGIYDLNSFLGTLSLFQKPEISFEKDGMRIASGASRVTYRYSDPSMILTPPNKQLPTASPAVEFDLSERTLGLLTKASSLLSLPIVTVTVENGEIVLRATDAKNPTSHAFEYQVPVKERVINDAEYTHTMQFKAEHLQMLLDGAYKVQMAKWKYGYFVHQTEPVQYYLVSVA